MLVVIGVGRLGGLLMLFERAPCVRDVCPGRARKYVHVGLGVRHPCLSTVLDRHPGRKALHECP